MRESILGMAMSLDGFVAGPASEIQWIFDGDQEAIAWKVDNVRNAGLHIMGTRTFRDMAAFWPTSTSVFAPAMNQIPKALFSKQGPAVLQATVTTKGLQDAHDDAGDALSGQLQPGAASWGEAYVASGDLTEEIARLKAQERKPIFAHGGAAFARSLIAQHLVDQYNLLVYPVVLGKGLPIFSDVARLVPLKLIRSRAFPGGSVAQIYRAA